MGMDLKEAIDKIRNRAGYSLAEDIVLAAAERCETAEARAKKLEAELAELRGKCPKFRIGDKVRVLSGHRAGQVFTVEKADPPQWRYQLANKEACSMYRLESDLEAVPPPALDIVDGCLAGSWNQRIPMGEIESAEWTLCAMPRVILKNHRMATIAMILCDSNAEAERLAAAINAEIERRKEAASG